ncbi:MAG: hypothetical protein M0Q37_07250 [Sphaerochaeta sp.]|nr:hypothetical protein [Sphaerochaeta sp.]
MKRIVRALPLLIALCCASLLFGTTTIEQASLQLATDVVTGRTHGLFLDRIGDQLLVAYQETAQSLLGRISDDGWSVTALPIDGRATLQGFAAKDQVLVVGYVEGGALYTLSSLDGGQTFLDPVRIAPANHTPSIQGLVIDELGTIHLLFHRHDRYWDHNYAYSTDHGRTYTVRNAFTRLTDSSSTGYSGSLSSIHDTLYTIYQDTNNRNMIKLGISKNRGQSWQITNLHDTRGGVLSLAVDPHDADLLYIGSIDTESLRIWRVSGARTNPSLALLHQDREVTHTATQQASVHVAVSDEGELIAIYLKGERSSYEVLVSQDGGEKWVKETLEFSIDATPWRQGATLQVWQDEPLFVRSDGTGRLLLQAVGTDWGDEPIEQEMDILTSLGIATISNPHRDFTITFTEEMKIAMLIAAADGAHELYHRDQATMPLTLIISSTEEDDGEVIWNLDDDFNFTDRAPLTLKSGTTYMLVTSVLDETDIGKTATLVLRPLAAPTPTATAPPAEIGVLPVAQAPTGSRVRAGYFSSFVISERGDLYASGLSDQGQLGQGSLASLKDLPMIIRYSKDVKAGYAHSLFLGEDGRLMASGRNDEYQLGDGTTGRRASPFVLTSQVVDMAGGHGHTLFVKRDGSLWAVGANGSGQLGTGSTIAARTPVKVMDSIVAVWANPAGNSSFALTADGTLYGWGANADGQLGLGDTRLRLQPTLITTHVASVAPGSNYTLVLTEDGSLWATGDNTHTQFGFDGEERSSRLIKVADGVSAIAAGEHTSFYIDTHARLWAAGSNQWGQWGIGTTGNTSTADGFTFVLGNVKDVAAGAHHAIALKRDGTVWTAGSNEESQLGDRSDGIRSTWKQVFQVVD